MKDLKEGDYIFIKWVDSTGGTGWLNESDSEIAGISTIETVGIIHSITDIYITIVQSKSLCKQIDNYINMPIVAIKEYYKLK